MARHAVNITMHRAVPSHLQYSRTATAVSGSAPGLHRTFLEAAARLSPPFSAPPGQGGEGTRLVVVKSSAVLLSTKAREGPVVGRSTTKVGPAQDQLCPWGVNPTEVL